MILNLFPFDIGISCGQVINLWRNSSSDINNEIYNEQVNGMVSGTFIIMFQHT
jgi:hypothetical protein